MSSKYKPVLKFFARTVMVRNGQVDDAFRSLNRILGQEKILETARRQRFFEPHCKKRNRLCFEACKRIYNDDMTRKVAFTMKKNRVDPYVGA